MTAQILSRELESIIQEARKKHTDLKNAVDKSLRELKALPSTSEAQLSADLRRRPQFSTPILSACRQSSTKLVLPAIVCLQRLVVSGGLAAERLQELLEVFLECSKSNPDIQLRVLQSLPSLLQNYSNSLEGDLQASILQVCTRLQQAKSPAVSGTSAATLQQVISSIFEKVEHEDTRPASVPVSAELDLDGETISVRPAAHDAFRVLGDLCLITDGQHGAFLRGAVIQQSFGLELMEAILTNHGSIFESHQELSFLLRTRLIPLVTRFLSERATFAVTVRATRILCITLREHLNLIQTDCEIPLSLLNHLLESDGSSTNWRRALCMETFRLIYCTPNLATEIYRLFDQNNDKRNLIQENLAHFVRLAAEKPSLIGVGQQSSYPTGPTPTRGPSQEQVVIEAGTVAGVISGDLGVSEVNAVGISTQWSTMKSPCLDFLDKSEPPAIPETYVYSLVLTCLNGLSEGLARIILPLTSQGRFKTEPTPVEEADTTDDAPVESKTKDDVQPLMDGGQQQPQLKPLAPGKEKTNPIAETISHMVNECWPAMLASSSTFLFAALDAEFYRGLIRSVQKFTQVAGLLRLATPRDAFFTTLAKSAIPANLAKSDGMLSPGSVTSPRVGSTDSFFPDSSSNKTPGRRSSFDSTPTSLSQRNLMCLRALINLAIALGSTLENSWTIIIESLQKADSILAQSGATTSREYRSNANNSERQGNEQGTKQSALNAEIAAVEAAITRLLQSTSDFPSDAFIHVLRAFCNLAGESKERSTPRLNSTPNATKSHGRSPNTPAVAHTSATQTRAVHFAISKLGELARINIGRLAVDYDTAAWSLLLNKLRDLATSPTTESTARLMAADIIGSIALGITVDAIEEEADARQEVQLRALASLEQEVKILYGNLEAAREAPTNADIDVHRTAIEALRAILEKCGESLVAGWLSIFSIVRSTFQSSNLPTEDEGLDDRHMIKVKNASSPPKVVSPKIARSAFACVQLICSDFLQSLKRARVIVLIDILCQFCNQRADLNISLTTITLFWNLSDFLQAEAHLAESVQTLFDSKSDMPEDSDLREIADRGSMPALWMLLQSRLASITLDERLEVRNGAVYTVFRILDSSGEELSPQLWAFSFHKVVIEMLRINIKSYQRPIASTKDNKLHEETGLASTTDVILKGLASTLISHLRSITALSTFETIWKALLDQFPPLFALGYNEVYSSVFDFLSRILAEVANAGSFGTAAIHGTLTVLQDNLPKPQSENDTVGAEKALVAYVGSLKQIYELIQGKIGSDQIILIAENLNKCIMSSSAQPYSSDVDNCTTLQSAVLDCFEALRTDLDGVPSAILEYLSPFIQLPYRIVSEKSNSANLTFVAFSKRAMDIVRAVILKHGNTKEIYETGVFKTALEALSVAVSYKYKHNRQGKQPFMWQKATTTSLELAPTVLSNLVFIPDESSIKSDLLTSLGQLKAHITCADTGSMPLNEVLLSDESFDLKASDDMRKCLGIQRPSDEKLTTPLLASFATPEGSEMRSNYLSALLVSSLIHENTSIVPSKPLDNLYKIRAGRTYEPLLQRRLRMSYDSLDELFALTSSPSSEVFMSSASIEHGKSSGQTVPKTTSANGSTPRSAHTALSNAAFEYLVFRCSLPLKRYIADQPLRGKMPTPTSQRLELLYVLQKIRDLDCSVGRDMKSFAEQDVKQQMFMVPIMKPAKRHLEWLFPLVHMASPHARGDPEISDALQAVIEAAISRKDM